ncbi:MAG TPA: myxosortase-dependent metalloprotease, MXAN_2677/MXAN_2678 family [Myxococcaceae bacterium]|jgi:uncharacterized membrane protein YgcG
MPPVTSLALHLAAGLLLAQTDAGYVRERTSDGDHCLRWPVAAGASSEVTFVQSAAGDFKLGAGLFDAVSRSEGTWAAQANVCSSLALREGANSASRLTGYNRSGPNENLVLVRTTDCAQAVPLNDPCKASDSCDNAYDCWDLGPGMLAVTLLTYDTSGAILDTDVEVNGVSAPLSLVDAPPCTPGNVTPSCVGIDVQNTVTHELGHALGLDHSPDPASTMYATAPIGETSKRILDPASKQFLCDVYPPRLASRDCFLPDGGSDSGGGTGGGGGGGGPTGGGGPGGPGIARTSSGCTAIDGASAQPWAPLTALLAAVCVLRRRRRR